MRSVLTYVVCIIVAFLSLLSNVCGQTVDESVEATPHYVHHRTYGHTSGGSGSTGLWIGLGLGIGLPLLGLLILGIVIWKRGNIHLAPSTSKALFEPVNKSSNVNQNGTMETSARTQNMPASQETSVV